MTTNSNEPQKQEAPQPAVAAGDILSGQQSGGKGGGTGSKSIGRKPLIIISLVGGAAALALVASISSRSDQGKATKAPAPKQSMTAEAPKENIGVLEGRDPYGEKEEKQATNKTETAANAAGTGEAAPKPAGSISDPGTSASGQSSPGADGAATVPTPKPQNPYAEQWVAHNQEVGEIKKVRAERWREGSAASSSVSIPQPQASSTPPAQNINAERSSYSPGAQGGQGGSVSPQETDPNGQAGKRSFLTQTPQSSSYLTSRREAPLSPYELKAGSVINGKMVTGINSDLPGQIIAIVDRNVFDTASGRYLLIPQGARLVGTYDSGVTYGQSRVLIAWRRIIYPDGSSIDLGAMPGADRSGYAGFKDQVNNHYARTFSGAFMMSLFSAGIQLSQPQATNGQNQTASQTVTAALGQQMGQLGMELARKNLQVQPTLQIRAGYKFDVIITKDIIIKPWKAVQ